MPERTEGTWTAHCGCSAPIDEAHAGRGDLGFFVRAPDGEPITCREHNALAIKRMADAVELHKPIRPGVTLGPEQCAECTQRWPCRTWKVAHGE